MRPVPVPDELPLVAWPPPEPFEYAADVIDGGWPPPEPFEPWGESGDDGWPPSEPLEEWAIVAEEAWNAAELADEDWPPRETDDMLGEQADEQTSEHVIEMGPEWQEVPTPSPDPAKPWTPPRHTSEYMKSLQHVVDNSTDAEMYWMRMGGCDLMPKRWRGVLPPGMPERPGSG